MEGFRVKGILSKFCPNSYNIHSAGSNCPERQTLLANAAAPEVLISCGRGGLSGPGWSGLSCSEIRWVFLWRKILPPKVWVLSLKLGRNISFLLMQMMEHPSSEMECRNPRSILCFILRLKNVLELPVHRVCFLLVFKSLQNLPPTTFKPHL